MSNFSPFSSPTNSAAADQPLPSPPIPVSATNTTTTTSTSTTGKAKSKPRKRVNTAEKRHQHNAIERQRRETLNGKFFDLARLLPALASHRRPSKSAIVNGSISHLNYQREQRLLAARLLRQLAGERDALAKELNEWRASSGYPPKEVSHVADEIEDVCGVEREVFGTFANVDDEPEDDDAPEVPFTGLVTPRPSTDMQQAMYGNMPVPSIPQAPTSLPAVNSAPTWSNDFAFSLANTNVFPFNPFLADPVDQSNSVNSVNSQNSASPASSQQGAVVTPQTFTEMMANHTPSPRSSAGLPATAEDVKPIMPTSTSTSSWNPAQMLLAHQQAQLQRQQQQQQQHQSQPFAPAFTPPAVAPALNSDLFSQQFMASMFANTLGNNAAAQPDQIELWRRAAIGSIPQMQVPRPAPTSVHDLRQAVRVGMSMSPAWTGQNQAVEGF